MKLKEIILNTVGAAAITGVIGATALFYQFIPKTASANEQVPLPKAECYYSSSLVNTSKTGDRTIISGEMCEVKGKHYVYAYTQETERKYSKEGELISEKALTCKGSKLEPPETKIRLEKTYIDEGYDGTVDLYIQDFISPNGISYCIREHPKKNGEWAEQRFNHKEDGWADLELKTIKDKVMENK